MITFHDISQYQGSYNMNDGCPVVGIKMSGGDAGLYYDSKASLNYNNATNAGKVIIGYHFAGGTDPIHEADFFIRSMSPLAEGDILCLDWEVSHPDPVNWCLQFVTHIHEVTGIWPLIYMNTSTCTSHDWSPVLANCGLWIADYRFSPDQDVPCGHPYILHQYTSTPLDTDSCFISLEQLKAYGYHAVSPAPVTPVENNPTPVSPPASDPVSTTTINVPPEPVVVQPTPVPAPVVEPKSPPSQNTQPTIPQKSTPNPPSPAMGGWFQALISFLLAIFKRKRG